MPDADDFDVEYFRALLAGKPPREEAAPAAAGSRAAPSPAPAGKRPAAGKKRPSAPRRGKRR